VIHDARAQAEFRVYRRVRQVHVTALVNSAENVKVQLVKLDVRQTSIAHVPKTYCAEFDWCQQFQLRFALNSVRQPLRVQQIFLDGLPQDAESVIPQREPQF
jgi:hypothetical protein